MRAKIIFHDIGIPSPAAIVLQAKSIVVGKVEIAGHVVYINVENTIHGSRVDGRKLLLVDGSETFVFDPVRFAKAQKGNPIVALGDIDATAGTFSLPWLHASLWPSDPGFATFPSERFDDCRAFVLTILSYCQLGMKSPIQLANALVIDVEGANLGAWRITRAHEAYLGCFACDHDQGVAITCCA